MNKKIFTILSILLALSSAVFLFFYFAKQRNSSSIYRVISSEKSTYEQLNACEKQEQLWSKILKTKYSTLPAFEDLGVKEFIKMSLQNLKIKKDHFEDEAPKDWVKYLHRRASVAKVKFEPLPSEFSGVFRGFNCGLLRLSLTYEPKSKSNTVAPGLALKILRGQTHSANISALYTISGQKNNYSFFTNPLSNIVPMSDNLGEKMMHRLFKKVTSYPEELLLKDLASFDEFGREYSPARFPVQIFFVPSEKLKFSSSVHDVRHDFASIAKDQVVYKVYAYPLTEKEVNYAEYKEKDIPHLINKSQHIGNIVNTSEFIASSFGDDNLFFRHELRP